MALTPLIQLRASESFIQVVSGIKSVDIIAVCEGKRDAEIFKLIARRLSLPTKRVVAVTDAEGINTLRRDILPAILSLIITRVARRAKTIIIIVDADDLKPEERAGRLIDSLCSNMQMKSVGFRDICRELRGSIWACRVKEIELVLIVNGIFTHPFTNLKRHTLEDHILYAKILAGHTPIEKLHGIKLAKELVSEEDLKLLEGLDTNMLCKAFENLCDAVKDLIENWEKMDRQNSVTSL